jgi:hypothetical protein
MNARLLKTQALPALLSGTTRQPLRLETQPGGPLGVLSLTGQALRLERPLPPPTFAVEAAIKDDRPILPGSLRRPLLRLLSERRASEDIALAVAWAMGRLKLRLHPFDLPKLDAFATAHAELLGATAQHWAARSKAPSEAPTQNYFDAEEVEDTNWTAAPLFRRAIFLEEKRRKAPAEARALLESVWPQLNSESRLRLLATLQTGLSQDDQPFLQSLAKDRAPRVRTLAQKLLARLPGQAATHPALAACLERMQPSTTGLLRKRTALKLEPPANIQERAVKSWLSEAFAEVSLDELARALDLSETAMIEAAEKDENLLLAFALMATRDRRLDLLEAVVEHLPDAWEQMSQCANASPEDPSQKQRWAAILIEPYRGNPEAPFPAWLWLHRALEGPAPPLLFEEIVKSGTWFAKLLENDHPQSGWIDVIAALCPPSQRAQLQFRLSELPPELTATALPLLEILEALEKAQEKAEDHA